VVGSKLGLRSSGGSCRDEDHGSHCNVRGLGGKLAQCWTSGSHNQQRKNREKKETTGGIRKCRRLGPVFLIGTDANEASSACRPPLLIIGNSAVREPLASARWRTAFARVLPAPLPNATRRLPQGLVNVRDGREVRGGGSRRTTVAGRNLIEASCPCHAPSPNVCTRRPVILWKIFYGP